MAGEAASALGLSMAVLAERPDDAACEVAAEVLLGSPFSGDDLRAFAQRCGVVTFDHEQVDLDAVAALANAGAVVRPDAATLELAVDKAHMRTVLSEAGVPIPEYAVIDNAPDPVAACTVRACCASIIGWRGYTGTTPVPRPMRGTRAPATARSVSASGPKICDAKAWSSPAPA